MQFRNEPEAVQRAVFAATLELAHMAGFDSDAVAFAAYEFGTRTVNLAHEMGIHAIGSLCAHQIMQDGAWAINHSARPLRPYFAAADDFRKPGPGGPDGLVMLSQLDKSLLWREYCQGAFEPAWLEQAWVGAGAGGRGTFDEIFMSRDFDLVSAAIDNTQNQKAPFLLSFGIEFSTPNLQQMTTRSNALLLQYAVERATRGSIVFCQQVAAADFLRKHYRQTPETVCYDPDYWCGTKAFESITSGWKPLTYPDLMQIENARFSAFFKKPVALPEYHWDYARPWSYSDWGNEGLPRSPVGVLVPGEHDKFAVTPSITDTRPMRTDCRAHQTGDALDVVVTLKTPTAKHEFPLALWDIPCQWKLGADWWSIEGNARFIPVRAPFTGNLNGILVVEARPGANQYHLRLHAPRREPASQDIALAGLHGKVFQRDGQSMAYLWPMRPWDTTIEIDVPAGRAVQFYAAPEGRRQELKTGQNTLRIPQERWARVVGLTRAELLAALRCDP